MSPNHVNNDKITENLFIQFSIENAASAIFWIDESGRIVYANKTACLSLEYTKDELLSLTVHDFDPIYTEDTWKSTWQLIKENQSITIESIHTTKSGHSFPVEIVANHLEIKGEEFLSVFVRDITKQKETELLLRESEERFRLTLDATSNGMWDRNLLTGKVHYGANWASSLGYKEEDLEEGKITWQGLLHPDDKENTLRAVHDHLDGKTSFYTSEFRLLNADNQYQWTLARGKVVQYDMHGKPLRFVGTQSIITERKEAEEQLKKHSEKIRLFAYSVAHDLKSPAIAIHGLANRLHDKCETLSKEQIKNYCSKLLASAIQIEELVEKINTFVSTKETPISIEEIPLSELLQVVRQEFSTKLEENAITWHQCQHPSCIKGDRVALLRVLRNFVDNSLKYGGDCLSQINIEYEEREGHHVISVKDNGVGLSNDDTADVFSPFERKSTSKGISGTGLGLAIVKEIAEHHSGKVWAELADSGGIRFCFSISKSL